jgi:hypothetical protein
VDIGRKGIEVPDRDCSVKSGPPFEDKFWKKTNYPSTLLTLFNYKLNRLKSYDTA